MGLCWGCPPERLCMASPLTVWWPRRVDFLHGGSGLGERGVSLDDLASEGSPCHFCSILSVTRESQVHLDSRGGNGGGS